MSSTTTKTNIKTQLLRHSKENTITAEITQAAAVWAKPTWYIKEHNAKQALDGEQSVHGREHTQTHTHTHTRARRSSININMDPNVSASVSASRREVHQNNTLGHDS